MCSEIAKKYLLDVLCLQILENISPMQKDILKGQVVKIILSSSVKIYLKR